MLNFAMTLFTSMRTLGPIVVETATERMYAPFEVAGLSFTMSSSSDHAFSRSLSPPNVQK